MICINGDGNPVENRDTGLCSSCSFALRKQERAKVKEVKPIKKVSVKRAKENQVYARLRDEYLNVYRICEVVECHNRSNQVHHMAGREGELLTNMEYFLAVCPYCHRRITDDSAWAISQGYSVIRST